MKITAGGLFALLMVALAGGCGGKQAITPSAPVYNITDNRQIIVAAEGARVVAKPANETAQTAEPRIKTDADQTRSDGSLMRVIIAVFLIFAAGFLVYLKFIKKEIKGA